MRISVINYTGDRGNWGSQATSAELLKLLEHVFPDATFHLVPLRKSRLIDGIAAKLWRGKIEAALSRQTAKGDNLLARAARIIYQSDYETAQEADIVVFQPEGTMDGLRFTTGARLLLLPAALAAANRQVICLNGSAETKEPRLEPAIAGCFQRCRLVAMREPASARFLTELGIQGVSVVPDSAFMAEAADDNLVDLGGQPYLAVTGSAIIREENWEAYLEQVGAFASERNLRVVYLLSAPADQKTIGSRLDSSPSSHSVRVPPAATYQQVARVIADAELLVGGRYHMSVLAATMGTPFVSLPSGSRKTDGLLELLDYPISCVAFGDPNGLLQACNYVLQHRAELSSKLQNESATIRRTIDSEMESLRAQLSISRT